MKINMCATGQKRPLTFGHTMFIFDRSFQRQSRVDRTTEYAIIDHNRNMSTVRPQVVKFAGVDKVTLFHSEF